ncbi:8275_t:CDS:2, partial [Ambispora gerdemannii]
SEDFDYCPECELNGRRYVAQENKCSECSDGSGIIKFPQQPPRNCKLCYLTPRNEVARSSNEVVQQQVLADLAQELTRQLQAQLTQKDTELANLKKTSEEQEKLLTKLEIEKKALQAQLEQTQTINTAYQNQLKAQETELQQLEQTKTQELTNFKQLVKGKLALIKESNQKILKTIKLTYN